MDFTEVKHFSLSKDTNENEKARQSFWKSFMMHMSDKGLIARMPKNYCKSVRKR